MCQGEGRKISKRDEWKMGKGMKPRVMFVFPLHRAEVAGSRLKVFLFPSS
jgi:hypothetical protein